MLSIKCSRNWIVLINHLNNGKESTIDLASLGELIRTVLSVGTIAIVAGYPACRLLFGERKWRSSPKEEKSIYSVAVGGMISVAIWLLISFIKLANIELRPVINGNEVSLTIFFLIFWSGIEVVIIAILASYRRYQRRNR